MPADPFTYSLRYGARIASASNPAARGTVVNSNVNPLLAARGYTRKVRVAWDDGSTSAEEVTDLAIE